MPHAKPSNGPRRCYRSMIGPFMIGPLERLEWAGDRLRAIMEVSLWKICQSHKVHKNAIWPLLLLTIWIAWCFATFVVEWQPLGPDWMGISGSFMVVLEWLMLLCAAPWFEYCISKFE